MSLRSIIQEAPIGVYLAALAFGGAVAGIGVAAAHSAHRQLRALAGLAAVPIGSATEGYVRVEGNVEPGGEGPLVAPLTGVACGWYRIRVEDSRRDGSSARQDGWRTIRSDESEAPFIVRDPSGSVRVDPYRAEVTPTDRSIWYGMEEEPAPDNREPKRFRPWENPKGDVIQIETSSTFHNRFRYTEERIYIGDPIFVQGQFARDVSDDEEEIGDEVDGGDDDEGNDDKSRGKTPVAASVSAPQWIISKPPGRSLPYMISTTSPADATSLLRGGIIGALGIGSLGVVFMVWLTWMRFG